MRKAIATISFLCLGLALFAVACHAQQDKSKRPSPPAQATLDLGGGTTADITVGGAAVPAGSYTIFTIPDKDKWTLIISKKTGEWGTDYSGPSNDLARVDMKVSSLPAPVEDFTIAFEKSGTGGTMNIDWESTRASVAIGKK
jgi:hypothetical protein